MATSRQTVHTTLRRWIEEGRLGLEDKRPGPKPGFRAVDLKTMAMIEKKQQEDPRLGGFRMHAALLRLGIRASVRACNRIMAHHSALYHLEAAEREPHVKKPMPFAASRRHQYWTSDVRYLDTPLLGQQAYCVTILDNFSRAIIASVASPTQDLPAYLKVLRDAIRSLVIPVGYLSRLPQRRIVQRRRPHTPRPGKRDARPGGPRHSMVDYSAVDFSKWH